MMLYCGLASNSIRVVFNLVSNHAKCSGFVLKLSEKSNW